MGLLFALQKRLVRAVPGAMVLGLIWGAAALQRHDDLLDGFRQGQPGGGRSHDGGGPGAGLSGHAQSICTPGLALRARKAWQRFLENLGPPVVGAAPGAGCFGPAYEFVLMADHDRRRRGLRNRVPITHVTPEPSVGHLGGPGVRRRSRSTSCSTCAAAPRIACT